MKKHGIPLSGRPISFFALAVLCLLAVIVCTVFAETGTATWTVLSSMGSSSSADTNHSPDAADTPDAAGSSASLAHLSTLQCKYYNEKDFLYSVIAARQNKSTANQDKTSTGQSKAAAASGLLETKPATRSSSIAGGIVPHHLLAGKMIAEFFQELSHSSPETLVVIAPNHKKTGLNGLNTSTLNWGTAFGVLEADPVLTGKLINDLKASQNTILMEDEHSISSLVPYIKYYLPKTKIVPILLHGNYTPKASQELGYQLAEALSDNPCTAVIASVDFSHYLDACTADKMDVETLKAIQLNDINAISMMGNDNLDSPPSIMTLLSAMEKIDATDPEVLAHGNSSSITGSGYNYTTSYYTMLYRR